MSRSTIELDFLGLEKNKQTNNAPKPKFKKILDRRRSFREIQGAISKLDPEIIKSLLASGPNHLPVPSTPKEDHTPSTRLISPIHAPLTMDDNTELVSPMTIFYDGHVSVFHVSRDKAENVLKIANKEEEEEEATKPKKNYSVITHTRPKLFGKNIEGDLPIARRKSLQRFLEKRKER
ncbi:unnamed protein product [Cochlearia groenlandica]